MSTPHFHTPVTSTSPFHTTATFVQLPKSVTSTPIHYFHMSLQHKFVIPTRHFHTNPSVPHVTSKNLKKPATSFRIIQLANKLFMHTIRVEVTCRSDVVVWNWQILDSKIWRLKGNGPWLMAHESWAMSESDMWKCCI